MVVCVFQFVSFSRGLMVGFYFIFRFGCLGLTQTNGIFDSPYCTTRAKPFLQFRACTEWNTSKSIWRQGNCDDARCYNMLNDLQLPIEIV